MKAESFVLLSPLCLLIGYWLAVKCEIQESRKRQKELEKRIEKMWEGKEKQ